MSEMLWNPLLVFLGGGLGAVSRYLVTMFIGHQVGGNFLLAPLPLILLAAFLWALLCSAFSIGGWQCQSIYGFCC